VLAQGLDLADGFDWLERRLRSGGVLAAPHLLDSEMTHVLRSHVLGGRLDEGRAAEPLADLDELSLDRYPARPLVRRMWELRHTLSGYDATYVALAEALGAVRCPAPQPATLHEALNSVVMSAIEAGRLCPSSGSTLPR
jgi:predicted nucleic acid-binding protein